MSRSTVTLNQISNVVCSLSCEGFTHANLADKVIHGVRYAVKLLCNDTIEFIMDDEAIIIPCYDGHGDFICDIGEMPLTLVVWNESEKNWNLYTTDDIIEKFLKLALTRRHILKEQEQLDAMIADLQND